MLPSAPSEARILTQAAGFRCSSAGSARADNKERTKLPEHSIPLLLQVRKNYAYGEQKDYFDHENMIGWVRSGDKEHPYSGLAVVLSDGAGGCKNMEIGKKFAGRWFYDVTGKCTDPIQIKEDGFGEFYADGGTVSVWVLKEAYETLWTENPVAF